MEEGSEQAISHRVWVWREFQLTRGIVRAVGTVTDIKLQDSQASQLPSQSGEVRVTTPTS